jgi:hypothetical protein
MIVSLNETEQIIARHLAKRRYENNRERGLPDQQVGGQPAEYTDLNGIGGEMAFAKLFNLYPDLGDTPGKEDGTTRQGATYDVKVTKYKRGHLVAVLNKKVKDCEFYILMIGEFPKYRLTGYATAEELLSGDFIKDLGHGPGHAMSQDSPAFKSFAQEEFPF